MSHLATVVRDDKTNKIVCPSRHGDKFWDEESNSFGYRMMKNMGWERGKGLGKNEHGTKQCIMNHKKNDTLGIGAKKSQDDEYWLATKDLYNDLLKKLHNNSNQDVSSTNNDTKNHTINHLIQSKISHRKLYSQFVPGKETYTSMLDSFNTDDKNADSKNIDIKKINNNTGNNTSNDNANNTLPIICSPVSIDDYFSNKLKDIKNKLEKNQIGIYNDMISRTQTNRSGLGSLSIINKLHSNTKNLSSNSNDTVNNDISLPVLTLKENDNRKPISLFISKKSQINSTNSNVKKNINDTIVPPLTGNKLIYTINTIQKKYNAIEEVSNSNHKIITLKRLLRKIQKKLTYTDINIIDTLLDYNETIPLVLSIIPSYSTKV